jgi:hypothetical protein
MFSKLIARYKAGVELGLQRCDQARTMHMLSSSRSAFNK